MPAAPAEAWLCAVAAVGTVMAAMITSTAMTTTNSMSVRPGAGGRRETGIRDLSRRRSMIATIEFAATDSEGD